MTIARWYPGRAAGQIVLTSLPHAQDSTERGPENLSENLDIAFLLTTLGRLWIAGVQVDWSGYYAHERRRRVPLPTYPFDRQRYWIEAQTQAQGSSNEHVALYKKPNIADWFYVPSWKRSAPPLPIEPTDRLADRSADLMDQPSHWLLFVDECGLGEQIAGRLKETGQDIILVAFGEGFAERGDGTYTVNPRRGENYQALLQALKAQNKSPEKIVHLWSVTREVEPERALDLGFYSLLCLAQALGTEKIADQLQIEVVTNNVHEVFGGEVLYPEKAAAIGACRAISQEYPNISCRNIDLAIPNSGIWPNEKLIDQLIAEFVTNQKPSDTVIAYRSHHRWAQTFEPMPLLNRNGHSLRLRTDGVYLITGGLGGIGLEFAEYLARTARAKLILLGRSAFPAREAWDAWLAVHDEQDVVSQKIRKLLAIEQLGAEVLVLSADVAEKEQMHQAIARGFTRFGPIHGVIHSAGVAGGGMIQLKTPEMAASVLAPKVRGTRVLAEIFEDYKLDFFVLCSSRSSILGGFGQVDYCAANAFLDAFAHYQNASNKCFTVSINWAGWQEVGMRVNTLAQLGVKTHQHPTTMLTSGPTSGSTSVKDIGHPLLAKRIEETPESETYSTQFSVATHWVLDDHRIVRQPIIPGTTYLEMVHAALEKRAEGKIVELRDVFFLSALPVREDEIKEVRAVLEKNGDGFEFRILSKAPSADDEIWQEYVIGKARLIEQEPSERHDINALIERCNVKEVIITDDNPIVTYEDLGPRWQSLKRVYIGESELVAILELPAAFAADVEIFKLHPALLDRANFTAKVFLAPEGLHLPMSYKGLRIKKPLPHKVYVYAKYKPVADPLFETITFDVILMDEDGDELVVVDEFSQKRVREVAESIKAIGSQEARKRAGSLNGSGQHKDKGAGSDESVRQEILSEGMSPQEGVEALSRILANNVLPQVVVSPDDLIAAIHQAQAVREVRLTEDLEKLEVTRPKHARPDVQAAYAAPRSELERTLANIWQETLGIEKVGIHDNFFELGGDSVVGIQMIAKFKRAGYQISPQQLFQNQTIAELAAALNTDQPVRADQGIVTGPVPLTPSQHLFFERNLCELRHFNQAILFDVSPTVDPSSLEMVVRQLLRHHDALRLRFEQKETGWQQINAGVDEAVPFTRVDLSHLPAAEQETAMETKAAELRASLDLSQGPLAQFALFDLGPDKAGKLLIVAHDLAIDNVSWWILLSDLDTAYKQLANSEGGEAIQLPPKTSSFQQWAERLTEFASSAAVQQEVDYWLAESREQVKRLPVDNASGTNAGACIVSVTLDVEETQALLHEVPQAYHAVVNDVLLTALAQAFALWTGERKLLIELEDHGREAIFEDLDLSRTVGPLRAVYPMLLELEEAGGEALKSIKEQLRRVPNGGIGYGLLRYLNGQPEIGKRLRELPQAEVRFSYLGQFDQVLPESSPFRLSRGTIGPLHSQQRDLSHLLEINGVVHQGRLQLNWIYSENVHRRATVERLAQDFVEALHGLIAHCRRPEAGGYTPSDFPLANVSQQQLNSLLARYSKAKKHFPFSA
jgi:phthiocerol/phenolphthiocerol synthesis type-I polyketide synthase E